MKKIKFNKLTIQNFLSIGEEPVSIEFRSGLHVLTGKNKDKPDRQNAVGKSTIADALYFSIFGETLREIKKELIVNNVTGGKSHVELDFIVDSPRGNNSFKIVRNLSPTRLTIYKDGIDKTRDSIANTTKYICDVLSASPAIFQNCVIMTVNNAVPFMAKSKVDKRKFIEDIFGMEIFSKMTSLLRQEYNDIKRESDIQQVKLEETSSTLKKYNIQRDKLIEKKSDKIKLYLERQSSNAEEILKHQEYLAKDSSFNSLDEIKNDIDKLESKLVLCDNKITSLVEEASTNKSNIIHIKEQYQKIGTNEDACPVCLRSIKDHDKDLIESEKNKLKDEIHSLASSVTILQEKINEVKKTKDKIKELISDKNKLFNEASLYNQHRSNIQERVKQLQAWQDELKVDIETVSKEDTEVDSLIKDTEDRITGLQDLLSNITTQLSKLDIVKFIISEEGVKSFIVNKRLELLNSKMYYYLKKLDSNSICVFDEYFEEQIVNEKNKVCSYFNFSGAERKAIDLACLFSFSDIRRMQGGVSYNVSMYDELFDSSFDEKGIELITDILRDRVSSLDECSIVISHRKESLKAVTGDVVFLEKENGITKRVAYSEY